MASPPAKANAATARGVPARAAAEDRWEKAMRRTTGSFFAKPKTSSFAFGESITHQGGKTSRKSKKRQGKGEPDDLLSAAAKTLTKWTPLFSINENKRKPEKERDGPNNKGLHGSVDNLRLFSLTASSAFEFSKKIEKHDSTALGYVYGGPVEEEQKFLFLSTKEEQAARIAQQRRSSVVYGERRLSELEAGVVMGVGGPIPNEKVASADDERSDTASSEELQAVPVSESGGSVADRQPRAAPRQRAQRDAGGQTGADTSNNVGPAAARRWTKTKAARAAVEHKGSFAASRDAVNQKRRRRTENSVSASSVENQMSNIPPQGREMTKKTGAVDLSEVPAGLLSCLAAPPREDRQGVCEVTSTSVEPAPPDYRTLLEEVEAGWRAGVGTSADFRASSPTVQRRRALQLLVEAARVSKAQNKNGPRKVNIREGEQLELLDEADIEKTKLFELSPSHPEERLTRSSPFALSPPKSPDGKIQCCDGKQPPLRAASAIELSLVPPSGSPPRKFHLRSTAFSLERNPGKRQERRCPENAEKVRHLQEGKDNEDKETEKKGSAKAEKDSDFFRVRVPLRSKAVSHRHRNLLPSVPLSIQPPDRDLISHRSTLPSTSTALPLSELFFWAATQAQQRMGMFTDLGQFSDEAARTRRKELEQTVERLDDLLAMLGDCEHFTKVNAVLRMLLARTEEVEDLLRDNSAVVDAMKNLPSAKKMETMDRLAQALGSLRRTNRRSSVEVDEKRQSYVRAMNEDSARLFQTVFLELKRNLHGLLSNVNVARKPASQARKNEESMQQHSGEVLSRQKSSQQLVFMQKTKEDVESKANGHPQTATGQGVSQASRAASQAGNPSHPATASVGIFFESLLCVYRLLREARLTVKAIGEDQSRGDALREELRLRLVDSGWKAEDAVIGRIEGASRVLLNFTKKLTEAADRAHVEPAQRLLEFIASVHKQHPSIPLALRLPERQALSHLVLLATNREEITRQIREFQNSLERIKLGGRRRTEKMIIKAGNLGGDDESLLLQKVSISSSAEENEKEMNELQKEHQGEEGEKEKDSDASSSFSSEDSASATSRSRSPSHSPKSPRSPRSPRRAAPKKRMGTTPDGEESPFHMPAENPEGDLQTDRTAGWAQVAGAIDRGATRRIVEEVERKKRKKRKRKPGRQRTANEEDLDSPRAISRQSTKGMQRSETRGTTMTMTEADDARSFFQSSASGWGSQMTMRRGSAEAVMSVMLKSQQYDQGDEVFSESDEDEDGEDDSGDSALGEDTGKGEKGARMSAGTLAAEEQAMAEREAEEDEREQFARNAVKSVGPFMSSRARKLLYHLALTEDSDGRPNDLTGGVGFGGKKRRKNRKMELELMEQVREAIGTRKLLTKDLRVQGQSIPPVSFQEKEKTCSPFAQNFPPCECVNVRLRLLKEGRNPDLAKAVALSLRFGNMRIEDFLFRKEKPQKGAKAQQNAGGGGGARRNSTVMGGQGGIWSPRMLLQAALADEPHGALGRPLAAAGSYRVPVTMNREASGEERKEFLEFDGLSALKGLVEVDNDGEGVSE
uniref:Uncharacterized protein n=1 Tax=Chromera velia CCMP2878 TaxID=1169474 RepID=A0A0G4I369_9ALVE|eukprot:Cvel_10570.t1-p1 / transcript=Cvel_10570.t1 / gene=Cvel_10570 / organism=Chromera_velia_CCMP2878 / gene_product=hypothetical protein / transcript_product=hypothetical protein / location=Cvel_scaffold640:41431-51602(+) / protein_length=1543 / sequence_SO=supercontig / SO=protein_coding / is_pseudo=false